MLQEKQFSWKEYLGEHARHNKICGYLLMSVFLASLTVLFIFSILLEYTFQTASLF